MPCCGKKREVNAKPFSVMGGYKYLSDTQIKARLEVFKRLYCKSCSKRYDCNFKVYTKCTVKPQTK